MKWFLGLLVVAFAIGMLVAQCGTGARLGGHPGNLMKLTVGTAGAHLVVACEAPAELPDFTIYVNGTPPDGYRVTGSGRFRESGSLTRCVIPLREFVDGSGNRFDPLRKAPVAVWVGGDGYDYQLFEFER